MQDPGSPKGKSDKPKSPSPLLRENKFLTPSVIGNGVIIDIKPERGAFSTDEKTSALEKKIHVLYPESSIYGMSVRDGRIFLGPKRIGAVSASSETPGWFRIWIDELLKSGAIPRHGPDEPFPGDPSRLSTMLPVSAVCGLVSMDVKTLVHFLESSNYAALVSDGYAVRLEFYKAKRAKPTGSFILRAGL